MVMKTKRVPEGGATTQIGKLMFFFSFDFLNGSRNGETQTVPFLSNHIHMLRIPDCKLLSIDSGSISN